MNPFRRQLLLGAAALGALALLAGWTIQQASAAADEAKVAANAHALRAAAVARVRAQPGAGAPRAIGPAIEAALRSCGISLDHHQLTSPLPRRTDSNMPREETEIVLKELTLRQALQFNQALLREVPGLSATAFHLAAPKDAGDSWTVRLTVSRPAPATP